MVWGGGSSIIGGKPGNKGGKGIGKKINDNVLLEILV